MIQKLAQAWGPQARILFRQKEISPQQVVDLAQRVLPEFKAVPNPIDVFLRCDSAGTAYAMVHAQGEEAFLPAVSAESALKKAVLYLNRFKA